MSHDRDSQTPGGEGLGGLDPDDLLRAAEGQGEDEEFFFDEEEGPIFDQIREVLAAELPEYVDYERLGRGGMGVVFRARHVRLDRAVAIKVLLPTRVAPEEMRARFEREAKALAQLQHPNIVTVHDYGEADGYPYLIMEFVDGASVRDMLASGRFRPEEALALVPEICEALAYAHDKGVVHRDIKPENLLVDRDGRLKIADFGIAKIAEGPQPRPRLTKSRMVMGTPHYMAPEQAERPQEVDHRADIYSLGVVFYEMLTGELPVGVFAPPSEKVQVDVRLDEVVLRSLEKEPARRYQTAREVKRGITRAGEPSPEMPPPPLSGRPAAKAAAASTPSMSPWKVLAVVLGLGLLLAILGVVAIFFLFGARTVSPDRVGQANTPRGVLEEGMGVPRGERRVLLFRAARRGQVGPLTRLLRIGVDPNLTDGKGQTPLHLAASFGHANIVARLLKENDLDVTKRDQRGLNAMGHALLGDRDEIAVMLLESGRMPVNEPIVDGPRRGRSLLALDHLFGSGNEDLTTRFIAAGAQLGSDRQTVEGLLKVAKEHGAPFAARFVPLLGEAFDRDEELRLSQAVESGSKGTTALGAALLEGHDELAAALVAEGRRQMGPAVQHRDLVHAAAAEGLVVTLRALLRAGASPKQVKPLEVGPLHLAAREDHAEVCAVLIGAGAETIELDTSLDTPLMYAARANANQAFDLLLKRTAETSLGHKNMSGEDVLGVALWADNLHAVGELEPRGLARSIRYEFSRVLRQCQKAEESGQGWTSLVDELIGLRHRLREEEDLPRIIPALIGSRTYTIYQPAAWCDLALAYGAAKAGLLLHEVNQREGGVHPLVLPLDFPEGQPLMVVMPQGVKVENGDEIFRKFSLALPGQPVVSSALKEMLAVDVIQVIGVQGEGEREGGLRRWSF